jgi:hypothetical protein
MCRKLIKAILCLTSLKYKKLVSTVRLKQMPHFAIGVNLKPLKYISENNLNSKNLKINIKIYGLNAKAAKEV